MSKNRIWTGPKQRLEMNQLPRIRHYLNDLHVEVSAYQHYLQDVQLEMCQMLETESVPTDELIERVAIGKIMITNFAQREIFKLKSSLGARALLSKNEFDDRLETFFCYQFAEGDNQILLQKVVRDHLKALTKNTAIYNILDSWSWSMASYKPFKAIGPRFHQDHQMRLYSLGKQLQSVCKDRRPQIWLRLHRQIEDYFERYAQWKIWKICQDDDYLQLCEDNQKRGSQFLN